MIDKLTTFSAVIFVMSMIGATGAIETDQYLLGATMTLIGVEYISKKGKKIVDSVKIPVGRKVRQSIEIEKKRMLLKAEREQRQAEAKQRYGS